MRPLVIASLLASLSPPDVAPIVVIQPSAIVQVICFEKDAVYAGTAFRVGSYYLSVKHVTSSGQCYIGKNKIKLLYTSRTSDFSMLSADPGPYLQIDCDGFVKDHKYWAIGFARGESPATTLELVAEGQDDTNGEALLDGMVPVIPGMSGGAIIDEETGKVVGMVNAENFEDGISWSVALKDTPVCRRIA